MNLIFRRIQNVKFLYKFKKWIKQTDLRYGKNIVICLQKILNQILQEQGLYLFYNYESINFYGRKFVK